MRGIKDPSSLSTASAAELLAECGRILEDRLSMAVSSFSGYGLDQREGAEGEEEEENSPVGPWAGGGGRGGGPDVGVLESGPGATLLGSSKFGSSRLTLPPLSTASRPAPPHQAHALPPLPLPLPPSPQALQQPARQAQAGPGLQQHPAADSGGGVLVHVMSDDLSSFSSALGPGGSLDSSSSWRLAPHSGHRSNATTPLLTLEAHPHPWPQQQQQPGCGLSCSLERQLSTASSMFNMSEMSFTELAPPLPGEVMRLQQAGGTK